MLRNPIVDRSRRSSKQRLISVAAVTLILVAGLFQNIATISRADAAVISIATSADNHGAIFFGEGVLQILVTDADADDDDLQEDITVEVEADPDTGVSISGSFTVPETSQSSGMFEFFIMHADADEVSSADLDTINVNGAQEYDGGLGEAPIIRFGSGEELAVTSILFEVVAFTIIVEDSEVAVDYDSSSAQLELDRSTYGSDSIVHMLIIDQDGNVDPTNANIFSVSDADLESLFNIVGAGFDGSVIFEETGDNTARFEASVLLADTGSLADDELVFTSETVEVTLNDMANYLDPGFDSPENGSTDTSSRSFDIDNEDGELDEVTSLTFASELKLNLNDNDRNRDSDDDEILDNVVTVSVDAAGGDSESLDMAETDDNTGVFTIDHSNNELRVTFLAEGELPFVNNDILELREQDMSEDIIVEYSDISDDDGLPSVTSSLTLELTLATGILSLPDSAGIDEEFVMSLTEADLNDNSKVKDAYTFLLSDGPTYPLSRGGDELGNLAEFEFEVEGEPTDFGSANIAYTLVETDINSGVFFVELDMGDIVSLGNNGAPLDVDDGDILRITYNDHMDEVTRESSDDIAIGKAGLPAGDIICMGLNATIVGTEDPDVINGTEGADVIVGLRGNDIINGLGGDDVICGELGLDQLSGGDGDDMLFGGNANDVLSGDDGSDMLWGGTGWDRLAGGIGNDTLRGGVGNDRLDGGDGDDRLFGQEGVDRLDGGAGSNQLVQD